MGKDDLLGREKSSAGELIELINKLLRHEQGPIAPGGVIQTIQSKIIFLDRSGNAWVLEAGKKSKLI